LNQRFAPRLILGAPEDVGFCPDRWQRVLEMAEDLCRSREIPALSFQVQRNGRTTGTHHFGSRSLNQALPVTDETLFLVASLTKPIVATGVLILVERGLLALNQPVQDFLPEMKEAAKRPMTVQHLLSHTSGLPDMLPENEELRRAHASLRQFVEKSCQIELLFPPGRNAQYQSMGYALLGEILQRVSGQSCAEFLHQELFAPLGMNHTFLGLPEQFSNFEQIAEIDLDDSLRSATGWNWNSNYWRRLGAPWGGVLSTAADLSQFLHLMLIGGKPGSQGGLLSPASISEAIRNRLDDFPSIPDAERRTRGWGLGWRLNWKSHRHSFCDLLPAEAAGHWGATGTLFWMDRDRDLGAVLLGTRPLSDQVSPLTRLSNLIVAALC